MNGEVTLIGESVPVQENFRLLNSRREPLFAGAETRPGGCPAGA